MAKRDDGMPRTVRVSVQGELIAEKNWRIVQGSIINRQHSGFIRQQKSDIETAFVKKAEDADIYTFTAGVMAVNREKYLSMSKLSQLETLPELFVDDSGIIHFELQLEGHSVIKLHLVRSLP